LKADFFSSLKTPVNFYLLRHGQSEGNAGKVMQGREEFPLSEEGRLQAAARGRCLKTILAASGNTGKTLLFSSPLSRARETAEIIARETSVSAPLCRNELLEMSLGIWSGKIFDQVRKEDAALWDNFAVRSWDAIPGAESSSALYERALLAWAMMRDAAIEQKADKVIAISHGGLLQWLIKTTMQNRSWFPLFPTSNCGLSKLFVEPRGQGVYLFWEEINSPVPSIGA